MRFPFAYLHLHRPRSDIFQYILTIRVPDSSRPIKVRATILTKSMTAPLLKGSRTISSSCFSFDYSSCLREWSDKKLNATSDLYSHIKINCMTISVLLQILTRMKEPAQWFHDQVPVKCHSVSIKWEIERQNSPFTNAACGSACSKLLHDRTKLLWGQSARLSIC